MALAVVIALIAAVFAWFWGTINGYAQVGASYGARVACSCRFVGGRTLGDCARDFEPGMSLISLSDERRKLVAGVIPSVVSVKTTKRIARRPGLDR